MMIAMKPGTLVKLSGRPDRRYSGVHHIQKCWFTVLPEHLGMYIKTIRKENGVMSDIILIEDSLIEVAQWVMYPLKIED